MRGGDITHESHTAALSRSRSRSFASVSPRPSLSLAYARARARSVVPFPSLGLMPLEASDIKALMATVRSEVKRGQTKQASKRAPCSCTVVF